MEDKTDKARIAKAEREWRKERKETKREEERIWKTNSRGRNKNFKNNRGKARWERRFNWD